MPALLVAAAMAWAGWAWLPVPSTAWVLAELPAAVLLVGLLWRDHPLAMSAYLAACDAVERAPKWRPPGGREDVPVREDIHLRDQQADLAPVVDLDTYRQRKAA